MQAKSGAVIQCTSSLNVKGYSINVRYLQGLGFEKNESLSGIYESVYRYTRRTKEYNGIELVFVNDFGILSVEEFWLDQIDGKEYITHTIVGKFKICSDADLEFIFSKNIRLNYIFNIDGRRV